MLRGRGRRKRTSPKTKLASGPAVSPKEGKSAIVPDTSPKGSISGCSKGSKHSRRQKEKSGRTGSRPKKQLRRRRDRSRGGGHTKSSKRKAKKYRKANRRTPSPSSSSDYSSTSYYDYEE
jgi:hypothetical protein